MLHFCECMIAVGMLNGFLPRIAENEVLGFNMCRMHLPDCELVDCTVHFKPPNLLLLTGMCDRLSELSLDKSGMFS